MTPKQQELIGHKVIVFAANYIYYGTLQSIERDVIWLGEPAILYETGPFTDEKWKDMQKLPVLEQMIERSAIESLGRVVKNSK